MNLPHSLSAAALATTILRAPGILPVQRPRPFTPLHTLWLAAECCGLKKQIIDLQTRVTGLEEALRIAQAQHSRDAERIAELIRRNQELTTRVHRTACTG